MAKKAANLLVVESPAKAGTISNYLGSDYEVIASYGHVRDLPKSNLGVDTEKDYAPKYIIPKKQAKNVSILKKATTGRDTIWLATDPDREGEAIAWHVAEVIKGDLKKDTKIKRVTFHEITKPAINEAIGKPRDLDQDLIDAQQARRVLDRLVGYTLSPLLWKKLFKGLSAGRVQSVALKFIVDREREREAFKSEEYWSLEAELKKGAAKFMASFVEDKHPLKKEDDVKKIKQDIEGAKWQVDSLEEKEQQRRPKPPFITSTLQQSAANVLGYSAKRTMSAAQKLYESGYITYMRTDSFALASSAVREMRAVVQKEYGEEYVPDKANMYKSGKSAQEAHEAIRPTHVRTLPETVGNKVGADEGKLYDLIWRRAMASQMNPAKVLKTKLDVKAGQHIFRANGLIVMFDGHLRALGKTANEVTLPNLKKGDVVDLEQLTDEQHFTEPPARYTEASIIKALEENGVGRPSTYAPTIATLFARNYVMKEGKALVPQDIGMKVIDLLAEHFPEIVDIKFTANMEDDLDNIAEGKKKWVPIIKSFYEPFAKLVKKKEAEIEKVIKDEPTDEKCPECKSPLIIKNGRFGKFKACTGFPDCKFTEAIVTEVSITCPACGKPLSVRRTKRGKTFYGCTGYPKCNFALWDLTKKSLDKKVAEFIKDKKELPHLEKTTLEISSQEK